MKVLKYRIKYKPRGEAIKKELTPKGTMKVEAVRRDEIIDLRVKVWALGNKVKRLEEEIDKQDP